MSFTRNCKCDVCGKEKVVSAKELYPEGEYFYVPIEPQRYADLGPRRGPFLELDICSECLVKLLKTVGYLAELPEVKAFLEKLNGDEL